MRQYLIEPMARGDYRKAQNIILSGAPGTGKTFLTTAFSQENNGVAMVSLSTKAFIENMSDIVSYFKDFYDNYGILSVLAIEDAEYLFTEALPTETVDYDGVVVSASKRELFLNMLSGRTEVPLKLVLTMNKPGVIDEAMRRRFLLIHVPLPSESDTGLYDRIARVDLNNLLGEPGIGSKTEELVQTLVEYSRGYPPAFVFGLTQMVVTRMENNDQFSPGLVAECAVDLKNGFPIGEIKKADAYSASIANQIGVLTRQSILRVNHNNNY